MKKIIPSKITITNNYNWNNYKERKKNSSKVQENCPSFPIEPSPKGQRCIDGSRWVSTINRAIYEAAQARPFSRNNAAIDVRICTGGTREQSRIISKFRFSMMFNLDWIIIRKINRCLFGNYLFLFIYFRYI